jgi:hypothetical protein
LRCQPTTVEAFMIRTPDLHSCHAVESQAHNSRSAVVSFGRFTERCSTPIWWRNARISNWSAARHRNDAISDAIRAVNMWPKGNRTMSDKSHFTNVIGFTRITVRFCPSIYITVNRLQAEYWRLVRN